ncbi:hypothetical protein EDF68_10316 [Ochrobactrum sp. BH3]|nr:hypothetical protein EDF68_10316 [Ochrobactrum sp. BH3]
MTRFFLFFLISCTLISGVNAAVYETLNKLPDKMRMLYITGMGEGFMWSSAAVKNNYDKIYCPPQHIGLNGDQYVAVLDGFVKRHPEMEADKMEIGHLMYTALQESFPCK